MMAPVLLLTYLYFLQGLPYGIQARFLPIYFRSHGMSLSNIGFIKVLFFPWMCKTLWAPLLDRHGNKKTWLSSSMFGLGMTCFLAAGIEPSWYFYLCLILLLFNFLTSTQDIATDGLAIEILTSSQVASGNIAQVVGYKCGAIIGGGLLAWLSEHISWSAIFLSLCLVYATAIAAVKLFVPEHTTHMAETERSLSVAGVSDLDNNTNRPKKAFMQSDAHPSSSTRNTSMDHPAFSIRSKDSESSLDKSTHLQPSSGHGRDDEDCLVRSDQDADSSSHFLTNDANSDTVKMNDMGMLEWLQEHFATLMRAEGTKWILLYVLIYKLGEQGALNMMPMFLIDVGVPTADVGLWTGVVGQAVSIAGSVLGGAAMSSAGFTALRLLWLLSVLKVVVLMSETLAICSWSVESGFLGLGTVPGICLMLLLLLVSGAVSTSAFTLMMHCSQRASPRCRASHYSLLATAEVLGKLVFSVVVGAITDAVGYPMAFGLFSALSVIVMPLFYCAPASWANTASLCAESDPNKKC